jgi:hypothetical protein
VKLQVLVDDQDKGTVELTGAALMPYAGVVSSFNQIVSDIYNAENPGAPDYLDIATTVAAKARGRTSRRRRSS